MTRAAALAVTTLAACATTGGAVTQRDFVRSGIEDVPLRSVELVVVVAGPPRVAEGSFDVPGFPAPAAGAPLIAGPEEVGTRNALARELEKSLRAAGFAVVVRTAQAPAAKPVVATSSVARTSSTASSTVAAVSAVPAAPASPVLGPTDDLDAVRAQSTADAILVVRAVAVDRFTLDVGAGTVWEETPLGRAQVRDYRPVTVEGRLLVGQAFLVDRASGVRLWSRQAPDYPADGRLTKTHPFLASGYVQNEGEAPAPSIVRATAAARAFGKKILEGLPPMHEGKAEARASLAAVDADAVAEHDAFFDQGHWVLDLGFGWAGETSETPVTLGADALEPLGPGATTPIGAPRLVPRVGWVAPGGLLYSLTVPIGFAPSSFGRTYVRDNPDRTSVDADRALAVSIGGVMSVGGQLELGPLIPLGERLFLVPRGGAFFDVWNVDATPDPWVATGARLRAGAFVGVDLWLRVADPVFLRAGADGRLGGDTVGGLVVGGALTVSAGLLL